MEIKLNQEQKAAVEHDKGPLLIVAGAGTGKTAVITERISHLLSTQKLKPDNILALTFTEKAAEEMEVRVDKTLPYGYVDLWISTFHSFCQKILQTHGLDIGLPNDFKVLTQTDAWLLVRDHLEEFELDYYKPLGNPTRFIHALIQHFGRAKDEVVYPQDYLNYAEKLQLDLDSTGIKTKKVKDEDRADLETEMVRAKEVAEAYHKYQQLLLDNNALDFGDLINYTLRLFQERPNILKKYREQFKYILVDEFQDTNYAQYELIKLLAAPANNITVVGDDDQSIYKFRGASISNILEFKKDYPKSKEVYLNKNYRSGQKILDVSYNFIQLNNPNRLEVKLATGKGKKLSKKLTSQIKDKGEIEAFVGNSLTEEVAWVVNKIGSVFKAEADTNWSDFAILVRANDSAKPFQEALQAANIPNYFLASYGLYNKAVVRDIVAFLKLLDDYHESPALWRILSLSFLEIPDKDLIKLSHWASRKRWSLYEALLQVGVGIKFSEPTVKKFKQVADLIGKYTALARDKNVWDVIYNWLTDSGYLKYLDKLNEYDRQEQFNYLNSFYKKVKSFENKTDDPSVKNFITEFNYEIDSGEKGAISFDSSTGPDTVKLMTVHSAKGLEFKYVFVVNMVEQRFPTINRSDAIALPDELVKEIIPEGDVHIEEERRLFYVAVTRAKKGLFLTAGEDYGGARKKKPSRFLDEIDYTKYMAKAKTVSSKDKLKEGEVKKVKDAKDIDYLAMLPNYFSFSQLKAFETCPWQYYYQYILKVPVRGNHVFSYGKSMHSALQKFYELVQQRSGSEQADLFAKKAKPTKGPIVSLKELLELYEESWIDDWYDSKKHMAERKAFGKKQLTEYYNIIKDKIPVPIALEKSFYLKIKDYTVRGFIDRIDELPDGSIEIIDYKTGKTKDKLTAEDKEQLLIYQIAGEEVLGKKVGKLTFHYLDTNKTTSFIGTKEELKKTKVKIVDLIKKLENTDWAATPGFQCQYCNFKDICDFKQ
ncbi:MAG: ATP-dependent helicase [Candidatus Komeilibacteria bacterium]